MWHLRVLMDEAGVTRNDPRDSLAEVLGKCRTMLAGRHIAVNADVADGVDAACTSGQCSVLAVALREGATNVLKYAPSGSTVNLTVETLPGGEISLAMANEVDPAACDADGALSGGFGLVSLAERAAGANGFLTKDLPIASLTRLLHLAAAGETVMGPRPTAMLAESYRSRVIQREEDPEFVAAVDALPTQLREVLGLLTRAASNRTIAKTLGLREKTAQAYVSDILRRTGCQSRAEVAVRARAIGAGPVRHTG